MPTDSQRELLVPRLRRAEQRDPRWGELADRLLSYGGELLAVVPERDMVELLAQGAVFEPDVVSVVGGDESRCHTNTLRLWVSDRSYRVATGWALSGDGVWRQHSWAVLYTVSLAAERATPFGPPTRVLHRPDCPAKGGRLVLVETTELRDAYYGYELTDDEAGEWAEEWGLA